MGGKTVENSSGRVHGSVSFFGISCRVSLGGSLRATTVSP